MRIVRLKIKANVKQLLAQVAVESGIDDPGFVQDVYALMRLHGGGLPDKARINAMADKYAAMHKKTPFGMRAIIGKRKQVLGQLVAIPYFQGLSRSADAVSATQRILSGFITFYRKVRQSQCVTCHLQTQCDFGKQYGSVMTDITKVIDPDYEKKTHDDCPVAPEISAINKIARAMEAFEQIAGQKDKALNKVAKQTGNDESGIEELDSELEEPNEEEDSNTEDIPDGAFPMMGASGESMDDNEQDPDSDFMPSRHGYGRSNKYDNQHTGQHICRVTEKFIEQVSMAQLAVFELGRKFTLALGKQGGLKFKPVKSVERDKKPEHIKSVSDITKVTPSSHALPGKVFEHKLLKNELTKQHFQKQDERKKLLYLLIDSSGSMSSQLGPHYGGNQHSLYTRGSLASVMSGALAKKCLAENGIVYARFFGGSPGRRVDAVTKQDYDALMDFIIKNNYRAGGTDIACAIEAAVEDIDKAAAQEEVKSAEIICITDCEDYIDEPRMALLAKRHEFNILDVSGDGEQINLPLKASAAKYYKVKENAPDINKLVEEVV
jgi:uncharacterized protein with von Willebrand factor type A (vWA) domain